MKSLVDISSFDEEPTVPRRQSLVRLPPPRPRESITDVHEASPELLALTRRIEPLNPMPSGVQPVSRVTNPLAFETPLHPSGVAPRSVPPRASAPVPRLVYEEDARGGTMLLADPLPSAATPPPMVTTRKFGFGALPSGRPSWTFTVVGFCAFAGLVLGLSALLALCAR